MNVVAIRPQPTVARSMRASDRRIARVEIFDDLTVAEPHWRALELVNSLATPYQRYDFLKHWQRHVGSNSGMTPFIVVGFNQESEPLFLLPLGSQPLGGLIGLEFLGGKHANFNMALWRRDVAATIGADGLRNVLAALSGHADVLKLVNQPLTWGGATNPFALLPHQRAANYGFSGALVPDFDALLRARSNSEARKKMRKKERTLASFGELRFERATEPDDVRRVIDAFFKQKSARMRALGMSDAFSLPGVRRFIEAAATEQLLDGKPLIELYALSVDDIIVATMGGIVGSGRFCAMFNSIIQGRFAVESPGEQLILRLVRACCERELLTFDLGIGEARYKNLLCGDAEPLFDSYISLSAAGRLPAIAFALGAATKRAIKTQPALWSIVGAFRRLRARLSVVP
ncbi:MAG TPA: GNAT family N-acetyltransferase [Pseudolabrys sp.]|nr:GNAT family N-acetyltransferase [Pseudolabrys sp.]